MRGQATLKHLDEVPAEEMTRYRLADGTVTSIWEKWIEISPRYVAFWNKWEPGAWSPSHGHHGDHINLILRGELRCGSTVARAGTHIMLEYGDIFGPWEAGPEGCELYGFVAGEGSAYPGDTELWRRTLEERGVQVLPSPMPKRLPWWWRHKIATGGTVTMWTDDAEPRNMPPTNWTLR
jgi:hypothetical protein